MTTIAIISDTHGNALALQAVLDHMPETIEQIICLGDLVADGVQPHAVYALLIQHEIRCVRGNWDDFMLNPVVSPNLDERRQRFHDVALWSAAQLTDNEKAYLAALPMTRSLHINDTSILCYHGSPRDNERLILPTTPHDVLAREFTNTEATIYIGGHTHSQMLRRWHDSLIVNPGSVGLATRWDDNKQIATRVNHAEYALITIEDGAIDVSLRRIPYDVAAYRQAMRESTIPHVEWLLNEWTV